METFSKYKEGKGYNKNKGVVAYGYDWGEKQDGEDPNWIVKDLQKLTHI